jgi:hypothetical protein
VALQQREVFQRRGVEHHFGTVVGKYPLHPPAITNVTENDVVGVEHGLPVDRELHGVQGRFIAIEHDEVLGVD